MRKSSAVVVLIVVLANFALWAYFNRPAPPEPSWMGAVKGFSFSPYRADQDPNSGRFPSVAEIQEDLAFLRGKADNIRTYSSVDGMQAIPRLAGNMGFDVTAGAWLDTRRERNEQEIKNLIANAKKYRAIKRVIVGNEAILREDMTVKEMTDYLDRVRQAVSVPVSTAETWHVWLKHPELAEHVDFIAIHILPYWEKVPAEEALNWMMERYRQIQAAFPNKPILLAEVGWPSAGERRAKAKASLVNQATFLRGFLHLANQNKLDYFIMEAFDQPWKKPNEGVVGAHWGMFDVHRRAKFPLIGDILEFRLWPYQYGASLFGLLPVLVYLRKRWDQSFESRLFFSMLIQTVASVFVWTAFAPITHEFLTQEMLAWSFLMPMQAGLLLVVLINGFEMSEMLWPKRLKREFRPILPRPNITYPRVSIHVPICNEPPDMVIETLNSLAGLDYSSFEVLVIDNNTHDPNVWQPVEAHCARLGERFRFFHLETWPGFKAGALNFALNHTDPKAEVIGVIDSDYMVRSDWLKSLTPYFKRPEVGIVQAPQAHRSWNNDVFKEMINWEYDGFFEIGMVHRNEENAIIQHGTMTLIRKSTLQNVDGWAEWCICEDAELGLRILSRGLEAVYVKESFGRGLTPDSFAAYKKQRFRWAYGAVQILKGHWRALLLPWDRSTWLTNGQRYHFVAGWLPWFADSISYLVTVASLLWTLGMLISPRYFGTPLSVFLLPPLGALFFKLVHFVSLYGVRVRCSGLQRLGAVVAGLALTHTIAKAVLTGLFTSTKPFLRTPKCEDQQVILKGFLMAREEIIYLGLLWLGALTLLLVNGFENPDIVTWALILLAQSLPYAAAFVLSMISVLPHVMPRFVHHPTLAHRKAQVANIYAAGAARK